MAKLNLRSALCATALSSSVMEIDLMFDSGWIALRGSRYRLVMVQWQQIREKRGVAADGAPLERQYGPEAITP